MDLSRPSGNEIWTQVIPCISRSKWNNLNCFCTDKYPTQRLQSVTPKLVKTHLSADNFFDHHYQNSPLTAMSTLVLFSVTPWCDEQLSDHEKGSRFDIINCMFLQFLFKILFLLVAVIRWWGITVTTRGTEFLFFTFYDIPSANDASAPIFVSFDPQLDTTGCPNWLW